MRTPPSHFIALILAVRLRLLMTDVSASTGLVLFGATSYLCLYWQQVARPICQYGNAAIEKLMKACPTLNNLYWPPPHCWNPHLQFVPFILRGIIDKAFPPFRRVREEVVLDDGELMAVDWVVSRSETESKGLTADKDDETPILVLHHGAMCDSTDIPGQEYIAPALQRGWLVCILNRRGHADMLRRPKWNFFGCVQDVRCVTAAIKDRRPKAKLLTIGLSSGTALVATIFGYGDDVNHFDAGVGICPGYSIERCMARFGSPYMVCLMLGFDDHNGLVSFLLICVTMVGVFAVAWEGVLPEGERGAARARAGLQGMPRGDEPAGMAQQRVCDGRLRLPGGVLPTVQSRLPHLQGDEAGYVYQQRER